MAARYYSAETITGPSAVLTDSEAHHLLHVMRAQPGMELVLFDGRGGEFAARVARCGRTEVELAVGPRLEVERELAFRLSLAVPMPKGERQRWLVEKAVELGVSRLVPLQTSRSEINQGQPSPKLDRYVVEASKQCGRNRLMEIAAPMAWAAVVEEPATRRWLAHPDGQPLGQVACDAPADTLLAVGPEGGLTEAEVAQAAAVGWQVVNLGLRILRMETAAVALASRVALA